MLKTRKLLKIRPAKTEEYYKMAPNWNISGTRDFNLLSEIQLRRLTFVSEPPTTRSAIGKFAAD